MKALCFKNQTISLIETPLPCAGENEALLKILVAGICNTDMELLEGYYGFEGIAGHEFIGRITDCPSLPGLVGKKATADINCGCGHCAFCLSGNARHCGNRTVTGIVGKDGAFAQYIKVPVENLRMVDPLLDDKMAVFAEPLAAALEISQQVHIKAHEKVLVLGDGKLGLLIALALRHINPGVVLVGRHEKKLKIARDQGINTWLSPRNAGAEAFSLLEPPFDIVVEATGNEHGLNLALSLVRCEGTLVVKTTSRNLSHVDLAKIVVDEIQIIGSRCGNIGYALETLKNGWIDPAPFISAVYPFERYQEAFEHARRPEALKVLLTWS